MVILTAFKLLPAEFLIDNVKTTTAARAKIVRNATKMKTGQNKIPQTIPAILIQTGSNLYFTKS